MGDLPAKVSWYVRWRTTIWSTVFFLTGLLGGNTDRIITNVPSLKYGQSDIEAQEQDIKEKLRKIQKQLNKVE